MNISLIRNLLHSSRLMQLAVKVVCFSFSRSCEPLERAVPVRQISDSNKDLFIGSIDPAQEEIIDISLDCSAKSEFAVTRKSAVRIVRSLMKSQQKNSGCYLRLLGINVHSRWFFLLRPVAALTGRLRKITFFVAHGDRNNPFFYAENSGVTLLICRFNLLGNAHLRQDDGLPTTVNASLFKTGNSLPVPGRVAKIIPRSGQVDFPIDLVYTWAGREQVVPARNMDKTENSSRSSSRFSHMDELRYSLRSLAVNADFVNTIYLVVRDRAPSWLDQNHPRIRVVSDRELIPEKPNQGLNSLAVESALHRLEGLADHFIYLNDDFFFLSPCFGSDFFYPNGIAKQFVEEKFAIPLSEQDVELIPSDHACWNSRELMSKQFGRIYGEKYKHAPYAIRKQDMAALEELFADDIRATGQSEVRSARNIAITCSLVHFYSYYMGNSVPARISNLLINLDSPALPIQTLKLLRRKSIKTLCINENNLVHPRRDAMYEQAILLLEHLFPLACEFEV